MRIEKNNDGVYTLICCDWELHIIHTALTDSWSWHMNDVEFACQRRKRPLPYEPEISEEYIEKAEWLAHITKRLCRVIAPFMRHISKKWFDEIGCKNCAAIFDDDHPKYAGRQHRDCCETDKALLGGGSKNENREEC